MRDLIRNILNKKLIERYEKWTFDTIRQEALKYNNRGEFGKKSPSAYLRARKLGILPDITKHMQQLNRKWTKEEVYAESLKYETKSEFKEKMPSAYSAARRNGWLDEVTKHMLAVGNKYKRMIYVFEFPDNTAYIGLTGNKKRRERQHLETGPVSQYIEQTKLIPKFKEISVEYIDIEDAQNLEHCTIVKYKQMGWKTLNKKKAGGLGSCQRIWTKERTQNEALKYQTQNEFRNKNGSAFAAAYKNGWLEEIGSHWIPERTFWSKEKIEDEAKKYGSRAQFFKNSASAYNAARRLGILNDLFPEKKSRWDNNHEKEQDIQESGGLLSKLIQRVSKPVVSNIDDIIKKFSYFETAQGSKYIRNEKGQLRRWKSKHANTGGEDMGLHAWSSQSIFVPQNFAHEANSLQHLIGKGFKTAIAKNKDGKLVILIADKGKWRPATWSDAYPNYVKSNPAKKDKTIMFEYSKEPKMGYSVVDFDLKPNTTEIKGYHFGSPVSKISGQIPKEEVKLFFPSKK